MAPFLLYTTIAVALNAATSFSPAYLMAKPPSLSSPHRPNSFLLSTPTVIRSPETVERVETVRGRCKAASEEAAKASRCSTDTGTEWWRDRAAVDIEGGRDVTKDDPLRVIISGGGVAGLVAASALHSLGMKVAIFEQASQYAPYGGPIQVRRSNTSNNRAKRSDESRFYTWVMTLIILRFLQISTSGSPLDSLSLIQTQTQIQSNALRAIERINKKCYEELVEAGTVTADR